MTSVIGLIPSRLASRRLPGKPLLEIMGLPLIIHVVRRAEFSPALDGVWVCTDSEEIAEICEANNVRSIMTPADCENGTERIATTITSFPDAKLFVDIQGDEPLLNPDHIDRVVHFHQSSELLPDIVIPTLRTPYGADSSIVRVLSSVSGRILYLTRQDVPYPFVSRPQFFQKHLSLISFTPAALDRYSKLPKSSYEEYEDIELLRALENDMKLAACPLEGGSFSVDQEDDYIRAKIAMESDPLTKKYL